MLLDPGGADDAAPAREAATLRRGIPLGPKALSARWLAGGAAALLLLAAALAVGAQTLPPRLAGDGGEDYCERVRGSFERTSRLARELAAVLDGLGSDSGEIVAARLAGVRDGLQNEATTLDAIPLPQGSEEPKVRGAAVISLLLEIADPSLTDVGDDGREELGNHLRDQFLAARTEARAATAALRQSESGCPNRRVVRDSMHLLGRSQ